MAECSTNQVSIQSESVHDDKDKIRFNRTLENINGYDSRQPAVYDEIPANRVCEQEGNGDARIRITGQSLSFGKVRVSPYVQEKRYIADPLEHYQMSQAHRPYMSRRKGFNLFYMRTAINRSAVKTKLFFIFTGSIMIGCGVGLVCSYQSIGLRDLIILGSGCIVIGLILLLGAVVLIFKDVYLKLKTAQLHRDEVITTGAVAAEIMDFNENASYSIPTSSVGTPDISKISLPHESDLYADSMKHTVNVPTQKCTIIDEAP